MHLLRLLTAVLVLALPSPGPCAGPAPASGEAERTIGGKVSGEMRISGRVRVTEDLLVLPGAILSIAPGTVLSFDRSESSKVDPEYFLGGTELVIRGKVAADGAQFRFPERSGGIVVDGGVLSIARSEISGAEAGITAAGGGRVEAGGPVTVSGCQVGMALFPGAVVLLQGEGTVSVTGNAIGLVRFPRGAALPGALRSHGNEEADLLSWENATGEAAGTIPPAPAPSAGALRIGDTFLDRDRTLSGDVVVDGVIRVAPGATLTVLPGGRIFFSFRDTDGDGIGESGIFLQGNLRAVGTVEKPIGFYPADPSSGDRGRWDSINFMASDLGENLLEHVVVRGAYRGLHAHFSKFDGRHLRIADSYRGIQFQESEVFLRDVLVQDSGSALRCRASNVRIERFRSLRTGTGANFLRSAVTLLEPEIELPGWYGLRFRESRVALEGGHVLGGLAGASLQEGSARIERFRAQETGLSGFAAQDGDVSMVEYVSRGGLLDGARATGGNVVLEGGQIAGFGRYAVKLGGPADVTLRGVAVSGAPGRAEGPAVRDGKVAPGLGVVKVE